MRTVYRYVLGKQTEFFRLNEGTTILLRVPIGAKFIATKLVAGDLSIFAVVDTERDTELRTFRVIGTGQNADVLSYEDDYIGSISVLNETYMYHIFDAGTFDRSEEQRHGNEQSTRSNQSFMGRL